MRNSTSKLWRGTLALLILFFLAAAGTAAVPDGEIWINTTDIKGVPGQTCQVPVMITTSGEPLYNTDLEITNPTNNAVVKFNRSSLAALGGLSSATDSTGLFSGLGFTIKGTNKVFFYLDVTPDQNTVDDVALNITIINAGEGTLETMKLKNYQATNATLNLYRGLTFTITASAGDHGSISPSGSIQVMEDGSQTFTITPDTGYKIADVFVDGNSVGAVDTYPFNNVNKDYTIEALFEPETYTITWIGADGNPLETDPAVPYGTMPSYDGETPTKQATAQYTYSFAGWDPSIEEVTDNATYTATFTATTNTYNVTWVDEGGALLEKDEDVPYGTMPSFDGETPTKPATAQYTYAFRDWEPTVEEVTSDVTYKANYTATVNTYPIIWVDEDGTVLETDPAVPYGTMPSFDGETPTKPATAQYTYSFAGWDPAVDEVIAAATYQATYTASTNSYIITWIGADGNPLETDSAVPYGTMPSYDGETPTKQATAQYTYSFIGWEPAIVEVTGDATYTAVFDSILNNYTVVWKNHDGTVLETDRNVDYGVTPEYNSATPSHDADERYTYSFAGWTPAISEVTGNIDYTATFTETLRTYNITVSQTVNGEVEAPDNATVDDRVTITVEPEEGFELDTLTVTMENGEPVTLTGYTFQMPTSDVTITAVFKHINYTVDISRVQNGTVTSSHDTAHKGDTVTLTLAQLHAGHIFNNFVVLNESGNTITVTPIDDKNATFVMPANHVRVSLNVSKIDYTITVTPSVNGTATAPQTAQVGDKVTVTVIPENGYQFSKLNVTSETGQTIAATGKTFVMPAENVTVNAEFTKIPPTSSGGGGGSSTWLQPTATPTPTPTVTPTPTETATTAPTEQPPETYTVAVGGDGSADFAQSEIIFSVTLPEDHPGTVELTTNIDPSDIDALAGKEIYHAAEITLDHPLAAGETALVHFMVPLADLSARGLTPADVRLYHHDHDGLTALPTVYEVIGNTAYYESTATEFSPFIIVFEKNAAVESIEPVKTPVPTETPKSAGFGLLAVLAGLGVVAVLKRK